MKLKLMIKVAPASFSVSSFNIEGICERTLEIIKSEFSLFTSMEGSFINYDECSDTYTEVQYDE